MASTPQDFVFPEGILAKFVNSGLNEKALKAPGAIASAVERGDCTTSEDNTPSVIDEHSDFLTKVLMKVCEERDLPHTLKVGAYHGVNLELKRCRRRCCCVYVGNNENEDRDAGHCIHMST